MLKSQAIMKRKIGLCFFLALAICGASAMGQASKGDGPKVFIEAEPDFTNALTAAMTKKKVPAVVVEDKAIAQYVLRSGVVDSKEESTGGKIARCLFLDCIGMNGASEVSVKLVRSSDSAVVWAYQVRKGNSGPLGVQSLSEAIAKHLKNDYFDKHH